MFQSCEKSISRKNPVLHRKTITLQHLTVQFLLYYLSGGRLRPGGKNNKISNFNSKSTRSRSLTRGGRLQEVPSALIWRGNFWYLEKLVVEERWSQPEVPLYAHGSEVKKANGSVLINRASSFYFHSFFSVFFINVTLRERSRNIDKTLIHHIPRKLFKWLYTALDPGCVVPPFCLVHLRERLEVWFAVS